MSIKLHDFDAAEYLHNEDEIAAYLESIMEEGDAGLFAEALGDVAKARGMAGIAADAGITREALYKALRSGSSPRFETVYSVVRALGMKMVIEPIGRTDVIRTRSYDGAAGKIVKRTHKANSVAGVRRVHSIAGSDLAQNVRRSKTSSVVKTPQPAPAKAAAKKAVTKRR